MSLRGQRLSDSVRASYGCCGTSGEPLPAGDSQGAIGLADTVNTHIRNIYAKLHAQDRSSAVQRAREMRLLSAGPARR
jgi:hypothetical protein